MNLVSLDQSTIVTTQRLEELLNSFIEAQDIKPNSKQLYRRTLKQYFNWIDRKNYRLSDVARPQIIEYKEELLNSGKSSLTTGSYITAVKLFYEWTEANKYYPNIAKGVGSPKRKQQFRKQPLLPSQATELLNSSQSVPVVSCLVSTSITSKPPETLPHTIPKPTAPVNRVSISSSVIILLW